MLDDLYSGALLEAAAAIPAAGRLPDADATVRRTSKVCGSEVELDLSVRDGVVSDVALRVKACALGQASASIFGRAVRGASPEEVLSAAAAVRAMLKEGAAPPVGGRWAEVEKLAPIRDYPARHASTLLVWDAGVEALGMIARREHA
jgi:NifU-like protein involved in Fe-S cluster formation